ncbi:unnamed protein product [Schistocephalus solidus]|uniref:C2H2-type domain-containing protein n=1 Tax=Schistocephalus solidus TaxID=70667 RepID=A0A183SFZ5_SCHSO|nr:unnamed protein product [Schistocephalus solidus]
MPLRSPLTGTQLSPVAPRCWVLPSGHTPGNHQDWRAKPADRGSQIAKYTVVKRKQTTISPSPTPRHTLQAACVSPLILAAWNDRSILDDPRSNRPERRIVLVAQKLACYKLDIAAFSETRYSERETGEPVPGAPKHSRDRHLYCSHYPRAFTHRLGLFGHMRIHDSRIHCNADNTDTSCKPSAPAILTATTTSTTMNDITPASTDFSCPHCACNVNSRIGLVDHPRIHRTEADEQVPGALTYSRHAHLPCPYCSCTFTHRMGLLGHMPLHDNLRLTTGG